MKNLQWCLREYARVIDMCSSTTVEPSMCWKYDGVLVSLRTQGIAGIFSLNLLEAAVAIMEGKPVFVGDTLYGEHGKFVVTGDRLLDASLDSWNPPKKKTFPLNGLTLPLPDGKGAFMAFGYLWMRVEDAKLVKNALKNLLEGNS